MSWQNEAFILPDSIDILQAGKVQRKRWFTN
jgi:hypothetical protein